jgi:hypothetical protein
MHYISRSFLATLSYCFQSLRLVCSSSHELLILGISVRIFLMQWFPLAFCMIIFSHTVGLLWTSDQPVSETSACTGQLTNSVAQEPEVHHRTHNRPPPVPVLRQSNPIHTPQANLYFTDRVNTSYEKSYPNPDHTWW